MSVCNVPAAIQPSLPRVERKAGDGCQEKTDPEAWWMHLEELLLATVQNHGGEGSGPVPTSPSPLGSGAKYKKRITNTEWDGGIQ